MRNGGRLWPVHLVLAIGAAAMVMPFFWQVLTSLKTFTEATRTPPVWIPSFEWGNFAKVLDETPFLQQLGNTVVMTTGRTLAQLLFCSLAAYAFARLRFPGRDVIFVALLSVLMVPGQLFLIPQYQIVQSLGWLNTLPGLIAPGMFSAFGTFMMRQFFMTLPAEVEEAARLDGANPLRIFWSVMLPLARPGLLALGVLTVLWSWNDLMWPLIVNTDPESMPLSAGLSALQGEHMTDYPVLMAGSLMASAPIIVLFIIMQKQLIQGIAFTGSK
ncbi:carbohydrate ABC transporter permease [Nonomuraea sp. SMC257]|uniref:Carbohydrate ABC transporter permease n=1 Tax=Nonomuraea montanisoli TaxID=2741721 RepID=A0A7Y6IGU4_9ACTN|nr:carbohydrate ABC transporter permease [Nonomuraea montanisoli]NUW37403.1 carbohydrate ABC transporter permease [Nonomuraea montanisoli]